MSERRTRLSGQRNLSKEEQIKAEKARIDKLVQEVQINREIRRQLCLQSWHRELSRQIDAVTKEPTLDPREEAILRVQNLSVKLALGIDLHTESDMTAEIAKLKDYLRLRHIRSYNHLYGDAALMLDNPIREGRREKWLWQQIRYDVGLLQKKDPAYYIRNFIDPEYKRER